MQRVKVSTAAPWLLEVPEFRMSIPEIAKELEKLGVKHSRKSKRDELVALLPKRVVKANLTHTKSFDSGVESMALGIAASALAIDAGDLNPNQEFQGKMDELRSSRRAALLRDFGFEEHALSKLFPVGSFEFHHSFAKDSKGGVVAVSVPDTAVVHLERVLLHKRGAPPMDDKRMRAVALAYLADVEKAEVISFFPGCPAVGRTFSGPEFVKDVAMLRENLTVVAERVAEIIKVLHG